MNVYVRELVSALAQAGVDCTTYTRTSRPGLAEVVQVEPGHRVVHLPAGPFELAKQDLPNVVEEFGDGVIDHLKNGPGADRVKHELDLPFVSTFHTLARVKAEGGDTEPVWRDRAEAEIIDCADAICVSCTEEESQFRRLYGNPRGGIEIVAPGVEHAFFAPGDKRGARYALGLGSGPVLLFVGRIQPLKGVDVAVRALAELNRSDALLLIVGGASGLEGNSEVARVSALIDRLGVGHQVRFVEPQPHHILSTYYRAADVVVVPSRSESFGLVALEAAACGIPVVASAVGGLLTLVDDGLTGYLVSDRDPAQFADRIRTILGDPALAASMSVRAAERARRYTWSFAAARLRRVYADLAVRDLVACT